MLRKEPSQRPASAVELRRKIERCIDDVERREVLAARMALPFSISRQLLTAPGSRGALICGVFAIGAIIAFGYNGNKGIAPGSIPAAQTSVPAQDSAKANESFATRNPGWSYLDASGEPFWSLGSARRASFAETEAPDPGAIGAKNWLPGDSTWDAEDGEPFALMNDFRSGDPYSAAITLDQSFSVNDSENEKLAIRRASIQDKDEVKKTTKRSVKKPQRRFTSRDRDREFSPLHELQRAREKIRRVIRRIL